MFTSADVFNNKTGEHCDGEQHLSASDHTVLDQGNLLWCLRGAWMADRLKVLIRAFSASSKHLSCEFATFSHQNVLTITRNRGIVDGELRKEMSC
jgi:hypothetical protein